MSAASTSEQGFAGPDLLEGDFVGSDTILNMHNL